MDNFFKRRKGISNDLTVYRGINDQFMQFLLSQAGFSKKLYTSRQDGKRQLDYSKIRENGLLDRINKKGIKFKDKAFMSTSTTRGFADYFPKQQQIGLEADQISQSIHEQREAEVRRRKADPNAALTQDENSYVYTSTGEEYEAIRAAALHKAMNTAGTHLMNIHLSDDVQTAAIDTMQGIDIRGSRRVNQQNELLLNRGMNYQVTNIREIIPGRYEMDVEVLTPKGKKRVKQIMDAKKQRSHR